jgi:hypothetical protein
MDNNRKQDNLQNMSAALSETCSTFTSNYSDLSDNMHAHNMASLLALSLLFDRLDNNFCSLKFLPLLTFTTASGCAADQFWGQHRCQCK